ncbi:hypothetical protein FQN53_007657 [Emmonsiellopsis sp. PD_33]|nr:hypothetical protein FQN53_007657 [Emmonsiellopsis sp. PD_33]
MRELDPLIPQFQHDKRLPREAEALTTLRKIASLVKPIMRQHGWKVGTLAEFYPAQHNLLGLNVNYGQKICIRLRYASDRNQFLPFDQVLDTMLHELSHNVYGPHDHKFHALWNRLREEHMQLTLKGYTGEGFLSHGKRLGGRRIPPHEAHRLARVAADKRQTLNAASGRKLGGAPVRRGAGIRMLIADAAQRRTAVIEGCASGTGEGQKLADEASKNGFKTKAEEEDANEQAIMQAFIDLIQQEEEEEQHRNSHTPPSASHPADPRQSPSRPRIPNDTNPTRSQQKPSNPPVIDLCDDDNIDSDSWTCPVCTLKNPSAFLCCDACSSERPHVSQPPKRPTSPERPAKRPRTQPQSTPTSTWLAQRPRNTAVNALKSFEKKISEKPLGWVCHSCGTFMETQWWTCAGCGTMKQSS